MRYYKILSVYLPLMIIIMLSTTSCSKDTHASNTSYTVGMGGNRTWSRYQRIERYEQLTDSTWSSFDTAYFLSDTVFALNDGSSITMLNATYSYSGKDTVKGVIYFGTFQNYLMSRGGDGIAYYYNNDSIVFAKATSSIHGDDTTLSYTHR